MNSFLIIKNQKGLSLIEIMVALVISAILISGMIQLFISNKQTYRVTEASSRIQENGRFSMEFLSKDIRMAGFSGCRSRTQIPTFTIANPAPPADLFDVNASIDGTNNTAIDFDGDGTDDSLDGSDTIQIQLGGTCNAHLIGNMAADNANIQVSAPNDCGLIAGEPFMISDCESADIANASSVSSGSTTSTIAHASNVNISNRLSKAYGDDAEILTVRSYTYFIAANGRTAADGRALNSLYRQEHRYVGTVAAEELVEGIDDMQITYGEDTDNDFVANYYVTSNLVTNMDNVVSVRLSLLAGSEKDKLTTQKQSYTYNGAPITAADKRLYRVFTSSIALRNRLP